MKQSDDAQAEHLDAVSGFASAEEAGKTPAGATLSIVLLSAIVAPFIKPCKEP